MKNKTTSLCLLLGSLIVLAGPAAAVKDFRKKHNSDRVELGPRPFYLVDSMRPGRLKDKLKRCENKRFYQTDFSIGHRGAPMQFPEHTEESYRAAAKMGAGVLECDVTFTADGTLVCRHAQCDLHTTTNIVATELNNKCTVPWDNSNPNPDTVKCCASDITLAEFKTLKGKMDSFNPEAKTALEYLGGTSDWRTDLYEGQGTLMTHAESIALFHELGAKFTPELKQPDRDARTQVEDVFGSTQAYAQKLIDEYKQAGIAPKKVWAQSFNPDDVKYWIEHEPGFGRQAVYLDGRYSLNPNDPQSFLPSMAEIAASGVNIIAPPLWMLLSVDNEGEIHASAYAKEAKAAGLEIIAWTFERSDLRQGSRSGGDVSQASWYYQFDVNPEAQAIQTDGDMYLALDVLAKEVGILGIFSDWPATVTYYANCMKL